MTRWRARAAALVLAALSMAHVGSPDTFFAGKAGPYDVRVSVRLPGVIPGRAQVTVRVQGVQQPGSHHVTVRAGQWNVGLKGAPPPEPASPVPGDPTLYSAELWFMTPSSYQTGGCRRWTGGEAGASSSPCSRSRRRNVRCRRGLAACWRRSGSS